MTGIFIKNVFHRAFCFYARASEGFTLVEVLLAATILAVALCGFLLTYLHMFTFTDLIRDADLAESALRAKAEEIKNMNFDNLLLANGPFNLTDYGFPSYAQSRGSVQITPNFAGYTGALTKVRITATYLSRNRTIGEDVNFNGILESVEDKNNNTRLDSSMEMVTLISE